jgi:hypothetical protein
MSDFEELENDFISGGKIRDDAPLEENQNKFVPVTIYRNFEFLQYIFKHIIQFDGFICGGYARYCCAYPGENDKREIKVAGDLDVYCYSEESYLKIKERMTNNGYSAIKENDIAISMKISFSGFPPIQLIKPFVADRVNTSGTLKQVLGNFDFSVARCGIFISNAIHDSFELKAIADVNFEEDEKVNRLRIKHIHCPIAEFYRIAKYMNKGFNVSTLEIIKTLQDWEDRDDEYKIKIIATLKKMIDDGEVSDEEVNEMERLLHID